MLERVLPVDVSFRESVTDVHEPLFEEEEAAIRAAVPRRRGEFRTVRACARSALLGLGLDRPPLVPGRFGAPNWPSGVVGSMTHCVGYRAAAVAWAHTWLGVGIDAEPHEPLPAGVLETIADDQERDHLSWLSLSHPAIRWDRVLFSAKESLFKVWWPATGMWLGFEQATVSIDPGRNRWGAHVKGHPSSLAAAKLAGRWQVENDLVLTALTVPRAGPVGCGAPR